MKKSAVFCIFLFTFLQCTNNTPLPNGYELLDRDNKVGLAAPLILSPTKTAHYWKMIPAGSKTSLLLGVGKDVQSFIILQCRNLAKISADATVLSAELSMRTTGTMGDKSPFTLHAHRFAQRWDQNSVLWKDVENSYAGEPLETWEFAAHDTGYLNLQFSNLEFIKEWITDSHQNEQAITGLLLRFDQAGGGTVFFSSEASSAAHRPYIEVISQNSSGGSDTTIAYLTHDASLLQNTSGIDEYVVEPESAILKVGDGTGYRSLLFYDVSEIPSDATIHQALLSFYLSHSNIYLPADSTFSVAARMILKNAAWSDAKAIVIDSTNTIYSAAIDVASGSEETFAFDSTTPVKAMSYMVQKWVSNISPNYGLMIYGKNQANDFSEMAFTSGAPDSVVAPTLVITYSLPAAHRFARP